MYPFGIDIYDSEMASGTSKIKFGKKRMYKYEFSPLEYEDFGGN